MKLLCLLLVCLMTMLSACGTETAKDEVVGTPVPSVEAGEVYAMELEKLTIDFSAAYFGDDVETLQGLLSSDYTDHVDTYPKDKDKVVIVSIKGTGQAAQDYASAGECVMSVEFRENEMADRYTYLTMEIKQDVSGPKVCYYGLEG